MRKATSTPTTRNSPNRKTLGTVATLLPLAVSMIPAAAGLTQPLNTATTSATRAATVRHAAAVTPKEFSVPISDLQRWSSGVVSTMTSVTIDGNSKVHAPDADCEMHFGAHSANFVGDPSGLVLEPMNACLLPFPGKEEQNDADWTQFAKSIKNKTVTISGVPRIWPEHLTGGEGASNPNHAVEFHPLTSVIADGQTTDFSDHISAGEFRGGVSLSTAQKIVSETTVSVTRNGSSADISFSAGRIGNFTVLDLNVDKTSIFADAGGNFRMSGAVNLDDGTTVQVRMVTVKGSPINSQIQHIKAGHGAQLISLGEVLVLFSLSPERLLEAANLSNGDPIAVNEPIQLILYGPPET